jgi:NADPH:quinone reductase-like Zn-dependent oxidoreductase
MAASRFGAALDRALEASVVGSFTRLGSAVRQRTHAWDPMRAAGVGRHVLVTGANRGLGLATAHALLQCGAEVTITARDTAKAESARAQLITAVAAGSGAAASDVAGRLHAVLLDLEDLATVRRAADGSRRSRRSTSSCTTPARCSPSEAPRTMASSARTRCTSWRRSC